MRTLRTPVLGAVGVLALGVVAGCSSVEVSPPISSCHAYRAPSSYGSFTIQQAARGRSIQYGAYPNAAYSGTWYRLDVLVNGKRYDAKSQYYPPHGSVSAAMASSNSGRILHISGNVTKGSVTVLVYNMQCRIM
jgi:hypothetical protein